MGEEKNGRAKVSTCLAEFAFEHGQHLLHNLLAAVLGAGLLSALFPQFLEVYHQLKAGVGQHLALAAKFFLLLVVLWDFS